MARASAVKPLLAPDHKPAFKRESLSGARVLDAIVSQIIQNWPLLIALLAAGLFAGFVAGMFGIGGGFVIVPALAAILTVFQGDADTGAADNLMHVAIGTSLATIFFTSLRSTRAHQKRGTVDWNILKGWLPWVAVGVVVGVIMTSFLDSKALKGVFGFSCLLLGAHFVYPLIGKNLPPEERLPKGPARAGLGTGLGILSSFLGIGGGTPAVLIMTLSGVNMHKAVGTAAGFGAIIAIPGAVGNIIIGLDKAGLPAGSFGYVNVPALVIIVAMSLITAPWGVAAAHGLNPTRLRKVFGVYLLLTSAWMLHDYVPWGAMFGGH